ncbi:hypothetical protein MBBA_1225 [Methanoculleus bourgensis]|jgi:hypothetical protein|uniref:Uncharacterized protein n=1 Tax=Methanoculleus bourgensis TaxID=83986 RepID=A0A0X3BLV3_9EURY|nr:protein of unknown function [Methanoculleus bourgensis]SAI88085.1 hypothetical protein MBBA_1225 [Methanoculleus bourgensis]
MQGHFSVNQNAAPFLRPARYPIPDPDTPSVACNKGPDDKGRHAAIGCAGDSSTIMGFL